MKEKLIKEIVRKEEEWRIARLLEKGVKLPDNAIAEVKK